MNEDLRCKDCNKFKRPSWLSDSELGLCHEGMYGIDEASDKNDTACEYFEAKEK